jgi:hypothetical protein
MTFNCFVLKGFFKRSILKKEFYKCFSGGQCVLNPKNRNKCKSCRFNKCIEVGMSFNGIKMGRIPKAEKERAVTKRKASNSGLGNNDDDHDDDANDIDTNDEEEPDDSRYLRHDDNGLPDFMDETSQFSNASSCESLTTQKLPLGQKVMKKYLKLVNVDSVDTLVKFKSPALNDPSCSLNNYESENFLLRFINLLEENKANLDAMMAKKRPFILNNRKISHKNKSSEILVKNILDTQESMASLKANSLIPNMFFSNLFTTAFLTNEPAYGAIFSLVSYFIILRKWIVKNVKK